MNQENQSAKKQSPKSRPLTLSLFSSTTKKTYNSSEHPSKRWGHSAILYHNSMIIFGGRHLQRSLSNVYSLDFSTLTWSKMEPIGPIPLARDSHTAVLYNNTDMIIFGGNGLSIKFLFTISHSIQLLFEKSYKNISLITSSFSFNPE